MHPSGSSTGVVLDSGTASTSAVPVYEGFALRRGIQRLDIGGRHLTDHFFEGLARGGNKLGTISERKLARKVKEDYCYVARDFRKELQLIQGGTPTETSYKLADGKSITVGRERFMTPEALFHPHLMGMNSIEDRMHPEMSGLAPSSAKVNIVASPERKYSSWIGESMVASLSTFQKMCVLYEEYDEVGPTIVLRRFF
ncbi:unnamed protein product [Clonostachys byssicola]|uniref:Actin n=1 Tax=Clonostachys byssicola TaxID=160290 RepID=A0A9N9URD9_9HYPO|nr:unnamed protein product [Clonostachys byssicola]